MKKTGCWNPVRWGVIVAAGVNFVAAPMSAQTLFQWPPVLIDVAKYRTPGQCIAFLERLQDSLVFASDVDRDTLQLALSEIRSFPDSGFIQIAARCSERYHPESLAPYDLAPVMRLYLTAGRDADAYTLATHVLASVASGGEIARVDVLIDIIGAYLSARPARLSAVPAFMTMIVQGSDKEGLMAKRMGTLHQILKVSRRNRDTVLMRSAADNLLTLARQKPEGVQLGEIESGAMLDALESLAGDTLLDSLRKNTAAYVTRHRGIQKQSGAVRAVGSLAPTLTGDYWFASQGAEKRSIQIAPVIRPIRGKVSMVVFLETWIKASMLVPDYFDLVPRSVRGGIAAIRRLSNRYPELEVIAVTETHGAFGLMKPPEPDAEADTLRSFWLDFSRLPGTLTIERSPFERLPDPDRRVIETNPPNVENYNINGALQGGSRMRTFIIDRDRTIIWCGTATRETEEEMGRMIDILLKRNSGGA